MLLARSRDRIKPGAPVVFAGPPFAFDQPLLLEPKKSWIDRALVQRQDAPSHLFDAASDTETMQRAEGLQGLEHHQVERAIGDIGGFSHGSLLWKGYMRVTYVHVESQHEPASRRQNQARNHGRMCRRAKLPSWDS